MRQVGLSWTQWMRCPGTRVGSAKALSTSKNQTSSYLRSRWARYHLSPSPWVLERSRDPGYRDVSKAFETDGRSRAQRVRMARPDETARPAAGWADPQCHGRSRLRLREQCARHLPATMRTAPWRPCATRRGLRPPELTERFRPQASRALARPQGTWMSMQPMGSIYAAPVQQNAAPAQQNAAPAQQNAGSA